MIKKIVSLLRDGKGIITVEDHRLTCGFGSAVLEAAAKEFPDGITKPLITLGIPHRFIKHDSREAQLMRCGINADNIIRMVNKILS